MKSKCAFVSGITDRRLMCRRRGPSKLPLLKFHFLQCDCPPKLPHLPDDRQRVVCFSVEDIKSHHLSRDGRSGTGQRPGMLLQLGEVDAVQYGLMTNKDEQHITLLPKADTRMYRRLINLMSCSFANASMQKIKQLGSTLQGEEPRDAPA